MTLPSTPYKGTRDFYPEQLNRRNYIFATWRQVLLRHGFEEYETSVLENAEMYIQKSGAELGGSQLYNFYDKGQRFVALRPEQTPSLARVVANRFGELRFPLRWFCIPNCFRYERPQKGRLREHWQLNVDIVGSPAGGVELELMNLLGNLFRAFGADKRHFKVMFSHRQLLDRWLEAQNLGLYKNLIYKTLDDWFKLSLNQNSQTLAAELSPDQVNLIVDLAEKRGRSWDSFRQMAEEITEIRLILEQMPTLQPDLEYELNPCIIRGIAYYTGMVWEAFDKNPENSRALFGGGRYDNLMDMFGKQAEAIGFGWGDVTMGEFLDGWNLWPDFDQAKTKVGLLPGSEQDLAKIFTEYVPRLEREDTPYDIDYSFDRSIKKRRETLKKRGCTDIWEMD